jgi:hypothetical protein
MQRVFRRFLARNFTTMPTWIASMSENKAPSNFDSLCTLRATEARGKSLYRGERLGSAPNPRQHTPEHAVLEPEMVIERRADVQAQQQKK